MKLGENGVTYLSFPPNLQDACSHALGYAWDRQVKALLEYARKVQVWTNLDELDPRYYGYAAASIRALYYSPEYDNETNLDILKDSFKTYMYAGTSKAEIELIEKLFSDAVFVPWYEYDGKPYHFKIVVPADPTEDILIKFVIILQRVKAQRSTIDALETKSYAIDLSADVHSASWNYESLREEDVKIIS